MAINSSFGQNPTEATGTLYAFLGTCVISGFRREVDNNCALLGYYAANSGNSLPTIVPKRRYVSNSPEERNSQLRIFFVNISSFKGQVQEIRQGGGRRNR